MSIIPLVAEQHAEEAAFLWLLRDSAVNEPHYYLSDLANLDDRTEANIDGLRIAGDEGWEICKETFGLEEAGEVFTATVLAFESGNEDRIKDVLEAGNSDPELARGIISALGWLSYPRAEKFIHRFLNSVSDELRRIGLGACAIHREDPGKILHEGLSSSNPYLTSRTLKAIGELGKTDFSEAVKVHLNDDDENCRFYASWSSSLLGTMAGLPDLQNIAEKEGRCAERACSIALRRMSVAEGHDWNKAMAKNTKLQRIALIGAGAIGDPALIPWLIEHMSIPEMARIAGESFSMITGVDLAYDDLDVKNRKASRPVLLKIPKMKTWKWIRTRTCPGP